MKNRYPCKF